MYRPVSLARKSWKWSEENFEWAQPDDRKYYFYNYFLKQNYISVIKINFYWNILKVEGSLHSIYPKSPVQLVKMAINGIKREY